MYHPLACGNSVDRDQDDWIKGCWNGEKMDKKMDKKLDLESFLEHVQLQDGRYL